MAYSVGTKNSVCKASPIDYLKDFERRIHWRR